MKRTKRLLSFFLAIVMVIATIPAFSIVSNAADAELEALITKYENMMKNGTAYKNMTDAYQKYVEIQCYKDAVKYGGITQTTEKINQLAAEFDTAINKMVEWSQPTATVGGIFGSTLATDSYAGILYCSSTVGDPYPGNAGTAWSAYTHAKIMSPVVTVMLWDGTTAPAFPVQAQMKKEATNKRGQTSFFVANYMYPNLSDFACTRRWKGGTSGSWNSWSTDTTDRFGFLTSDGQSHQYPLENKVYYFNNKVQFNTNYADTTKYYNTYTNMEFLYNGAAAVNDGSARTLYTALNTTQYVINYAPVVTMIDTCKDNLQTYYPVNNYKEGGLISLIEKSDALTAIDPNSYFRSATDSNAGTQTVSCATAIKTAIGKTISVTADTKGYYDELRAALDKATYTANDDCYGSSDWTAYTNAKNAAEGAFRDVGLNNTYASTYNGTSIQELANNLNTAINNLKDAKRKEHNTLKFTSESGDTASYVCASKASHSSDVKTGNIQNYNTLKMIYSTIDTGAYKDDAKTALNKAKADFDNVLNSSVTVDVSSQTLQTYIDSKTSALLNAINTDGQSGSPAVNQYTVTFNVLVDGAQAHTETINANYGTVVTLNASSYVNGGTCSSWGIAIGGKTKTVAQPKNTYTILVQGDTTVTANCVSGNAVIIQDQYGNDLYVVPATIGSTVSCSGNVVTVNSTAYTIPNMPYITINGYTANGKKVTGDVTTTESTTIIRPVSAYSTDATYTITLDGAKVESDVVYDQKVTVTAAEGVKGIAILNGDGTYSIASYSNSYEFYANRSMDFYTVTGSNGNYTINDSPVTDKLMIFSLDNSLPFIYSASSTVKVSDTKSKMTTFSAYTTELPAGVTVIESGTLYSKATDLSATSFVIDSGRSDIFQKASATHIDFSNQFSLSFTTGDKVYTRGYVKYTYTYDGKQITAVAYSNICESN